MRRSTSLLLPLLLMLALVLMAASVVFQARRALGRASRTAASAHQLAFTLRPLDTEARATENPGFEASPASPMGAMAGAELEGQLYLAGPGGLRIVTQDRSLKVELHTGQELPAAPLTAVAVGRLRGESEPEVMLATAGAGVLLLTPHGTAAPGLRQLLPAGEEQRDVTALLPLATGDVLLGTRTAGVLVFRGDSLQPLALNLPGVDTGRLQVTALASPQGDPATVLIGTAKNGLFLLRGGIAEHADTGSGLADNRVESIALRGHMAFAGTPLGISQFDLDATGFSPVRTLAAGLFAHALAATTDGLAVGTMDQGIRQVSFATKAYVRRTTITAEAEDSLAAGASSSGRVDAFVGQPGAGLLALKQDMVLQRTASGWVAAEEGLPQSAVLTDRNISALAFAPNGDLYVGYFDRGLDIVTPDSAGPESTAAPRHFEDDHLFCINRLALDPMRHSMAVATADGLVLFDGQGTPRQVLSRHDGLISDHVSDIAFTQSGEVLATPAGLTYLTATGAQSLYAFQGLVNNHVYALAADPATSRVLAGTLGGLSVLDAGAVTHSFTSSNSGLGHNWITALAPLPGGACLVGTYGAGLAQLSAAGVVTPVDLPAGVPRDVIVNPNALLVTPGHIVAGTLAHGMLVYSRASGRWSAMTAGLPSRNVTAFAEHDGELYVGTDNGLVRIAEARLP
jgi:hypothetical protein